MTYLKSLICLAIFLLAYGQSVEAQRNSMYGRKSKDAFPDAIQYELKGWQVEPGITYTGLGLIGTSKPMDALGGDTAKFNPSGKLGFDISAGRYVIFEYPWFFKYMDYGIGYKTLKGKEKWEAKNSSLSGEGEWKEGDITAYFNIHHVIPISDYVFIDNGIGANLDYRLIRKSTYSSGGLTPLYPTRFGFQPHYRLGYGFRPGQRVLMVLGLETPILNIIPLELPKSTLGYLNSRYRPFLLTLKIMFLSPKRDVCPPVYDPAKRDKSIQEGSEGQ